MVSGSNKKELVFAKDKKQGFLAVFAVFLFIGSLIYLKNAMPSNDSAAPPPQTQETTVSQNNNDPAQNAEADQQNLAQDASNIFSQTLNMQGNKDQTTVNIPTVSTGEDVEIIAKQRAQGRMVSIAVTDSGSIDPFLPSGEKMITHITKHHTTAAISLPYLTPPPENLPVDPDAGKIMNTTISGILYDKYSPSAIINIDGTDYLVKKGDTIKRYKVLSIGKSMVIVQLGRNVYTAGVGEILSPTDLQNVTANLNRKFGGNDVTINIKKKG